MAAAGANKKLCGANLKSGRTCRNVAGKGTDHLGAGRCSRHLGSTRNHKMAAQREQARQACEVFQLPAEHREPSEVLYDEIDRARAAMSWFEREIALAMMAGDDELRDRRWQGWLAERKIAASVSVEVQRLGLDRRRVEMQEDMVRQVVAVLTECVRRLGLDPGSLEVRRAMRASLELVAGARQCRSRCE
jgi:hypothetical protein